MWIIVAEVEPNIKYYCHKLLEKQQVQQFCDSKLMDVNF